MGKNLIIDNVEYRVVAVNNKPRPDPRQAARFNTNALLLNPVWASLDHVGVSNDGETVAFYDHSVFLRDSGSLVVTTMLCRAVPAGIQIVKAFPPRIQNPR